MFHARARLSSNDHPLLVCFLLALADSNGVEGIFDDVLGDFRESMTTVLASRVASMDKRRNVLLLKDLDQASFSKVAPFNRLLELRKHAVR